MTSPEFTPWWEKPNEFLRFDEREEFRQGIKGVRPNIRQEMLFNMISAGYVNNKFEKPESYTGKQKK
jgi:hypothetical protein